MTAIRDAIAGVVRLTEFEDLARASMDPAEYDYIASGAFDELSLAENEAAWLRRRFRPRVLVDVSSVATATTMLGSPVAFPMAIAPMAVHGLAHPEAEIATARAAGAAGVPFILSTMATHSLEDVAAGAPDTTCWFQLYVQRDPGRTRSFVERAAAAGCGAVVVTVDLPVLGYRERDMRSGFELPLLGNFRDEPPTHRTLHQAALDPGADVLSKSLTWTDLASIRTWSGLPLVLKGILTAEDARLAVEHGADAIVVSNHGARQLDRTPAPVDVLAEIVEAVGGRTEVWVDGGVRRGLDIAMALALGARGVLVGRPMLWALAAGGQPGVERALAILRTEFEVALALLGTPTPADITRDHLV
jgi:4-hydroxymandelate oxidase